MRKKQFSYFSFRIFFGFWAKNFSDFWPKNFKKLSKLTSVCADEQFLAWRNFKSFKPFWIFCINPWHGSQNSINVSRVKVAEEIVFWFFFSEFFSDFEQKFFHSFFQKTSKCCQNYILRVQRNNLWLEIFLVFWIFLGFLQKPLACFSNFYLRVQSRNCGKK